MNKILARLMMTCSEKITKEQIEAFQAFKDAPADLDSTPKELQALLTFNLDDFRPLASQTPEQQAGPIELSRQEMMMQTVVEVCNSVLYICLGFE